MSGWERYPTDVLTAFAHAGVTGAAEELAERQLQLPEALPGDVAIYEASGVGLEPTGQVPERR